MRKIMKNPKVITVADYCTDVSASTPVVAIIDTDDYIVDGQSIVDQVAIPADRKILAQMADASHEKYVAASIQEDVSKGKSDYYAIWQEAERLQRINKIIRNASMYGVKVQNSTTPK
ncbi:MAG: hypothetical protein K8823_1516, partial [Cenarchaeum symbiont of Oopsacas minuta]|nr:hypothetical protein [Cenarchaeum symbiont of Oopsacas minuta]